MCIIYIYFLPLPLLSWSRRRPGAVGQVFKQWLRPRSFYVYAIPITFIIPEIPCKAIAYRHNRFSCLSVHCRWYCYVHYCAKLELRFQLPCLDWNCGNSFRLYGLTRPSDVPGPSGIPRPSALSIKFSIPLWSNDDEYATHKWMIGENIQVKDTRSRSTINSILKIYFGRRIPGR